MTTKTTKLGQGSLISMAGVQYMMLDKGPPIAAPTLTHGHRRKLRGKMGRSYPSPNVIDTSLGGVVMVQQCHRTFDIDSKDRVHEGRDP